MAANCSGTGAHLDEEPLTRELPEVEMERPSTSSQAIKRASVVVLQKPKIGAAVSLRTELVLRETELSYDGGKKSVLLEDFIGVNILPKPPSNRITCEIDIHHYPVVQRAQGMDKPSVRKMAVVTVCFDGGATFKENVVTAVDWKSAIKKQVDVAMRLAFDFADVNGLPLGDDDDSLLVPRHLLVFINPVGGRGKGVSLFENEVRPLFDLAEINYNVVVTAHQNHAREVAKDYDFSQIHGIVVSSGDGLLYEVINGLMEREDWESAIKTPIGMLPTGSGNALCASVLYEENEGFSLTDAAFQIIRGGVIPMDIATVHTCDRQTCYVSLLINWGMVADVDIESERFRKIGESRFVLGALYCIVKKRHYDAKVFYLPIEDTQSTQHRDNPQEISTPPARTLSLSTPEPHLDTTSCEEGPGSSERRSGRIEREPGSSEGGDSTALERTGDSLSPSQEDGRLVDPGSDRETQLQSNETTTTQEQVLLHVNGEPELPTSNGDTAVCSTTSQQSTDSQTTLTHTTGATQENGYDVDSDNTTSTPIAATNGATSPQSIESASNGDSEHKTISQSIVPSERRMVSPIKTSYLPPLNEDLPDDWLPFDRCESYLSITALMIPHMSRSFFGDPKLSIGTGKIRLVYISSSLSRKDMLDVLTGADTGHHMTMQGVGYVDCKAFRLVPVTPEGLLTVDGEEVHYGPMQAEVHAHLGRVMCRRRRGRGREEGSE